MDDIAFVNCNQSYQPPGKLGSSTGNGFININIICCVLSHVLFTVLISGGFCNSNVLRLLLSSLCIWLFIWKRSVCLDARGWRWVGLVPNVRSHWNPQHWTSRRPHNQQRSMWSWKVDSQEMPKFHSHDEGNVVCCSTGRYLYVDSFLPHTKGKMAQLKSLLLPPAGEEGYCFTLRYHMFGATVGSLKMFLQTANPLKKTLVKYYKFNYQNNNRNNTSSQCQKKKYWWIRLRNIALCWHTFKVIVKCQLHNNINVWYAGFGLHSLHTAVLQKPPHILIATSESASCLSCRCGKNQEIKRTSGCWCRVMWHYSKSTKWF